MEYSYNGITVSKISSEDMLEQLPFTRVYTIAADQAWKIGIVYNAKRQIRGFPGGHSEEGEHYDETAYREYNEETWYQLKALQPAYLLKNSGNQDVSFDLIVFGRLGAQSIEYQDIHESVTEVAFVSLSELWKKIGNKPLWEPILDAFLSYESLQRLDREE